MADSETPNPAPAHNPAAKVMWLFINGFKFLLVLIIVFEISTYFLLTMTSTAFYDCNIVIKQILS